MGESSVWYRDSLALQKISKITRKDFERDGFVFEESIEKIGNEPHIYISKAFCPTAGLTIMLYSPCMWRGKFAFVSDYDAHEYVGSPEEIISSYNNDHKYQQCLIKRHTKKIECFSDLSSDFSVIEHEEFCSDSPEIRVEFSKYRLDAVYDDVGEYCWFFPTYQGKQIRDEQEIQKVVTRLAKLLPNPTQIKLDEFLMQMKHS